MIIRTIFDVGLKHPSIDWVPPTMGALHNNIKIVRVDVQPVLRSIVTDHITESLFNFGSDGVFTCVHVCDVGVFQPLGKFCPCFVRDVVGLTNVDTPYAVLGRLEHTEKMHHLIISHGFIEILQNFDRGEKKDEQIDVNGGKGLKVNATQSQTHLDVKSLAIRVFFQCIEGSIHNDWCNIRVIKIFLQFEHHHV